MNGSAILSRLSYWDLIGERHDPAENNYVGWRKKDIDLLQKRNLELKKLLSRSYYDFNLYVILDPVVGKYMQQRLPREEAVGFGEVESVLRYHYPERDDVGVEPDEGGISVVLTGDGADVGKQGIMAPTPWIVVHWIAHGVLKSDPNDRGRWYEKLHDAFADMASAFSHQLRQPQPIGSYADIKMKSLMEEMFVFRSARRKKLRDVPEGWHELMAHYIVANKVVVNKKLPIAFATTNKAQWKKESKKFAKKAERILDSALDFARGQWFVI